jgi:tetratricopeptide (TPR) repeat protein
MDPAGSWRPQSQSVSIIMSAMDVEAEHDAITRGEAALRAGDWEGARALFEAALEDEESPMAHAGLGRALWWLQDTEGAISQIEKSYAGNRAAGEIRGGSRQCSLALAGVRGRLWQLGGQRGVVRAGRGPAAGCGGCPRAGMAVAHPS